MILNQYYLGCLAHASYFLGDESSGVAAVVDPQRDIGQYIEEAAARNMTIEHVFLTHFHADFAAGHLELRDRTGAMIHLGARAEADYPFEPMRDGGGMDLGAIRLAFLETPGHSPESVCILVFDPNEAASPFAALTGDTLFIGDVGRPDLRAALGWKAEDLANLLYDSLHGKLIPATVDETLVYPAHGAGSLCGKNLSTDTVSTMGDQKKYNYALQPMDRETFTRLITTDQPEAPSYFTYDAAFNAQEHETLDHLLKRNLNPLSLEEVLRKAEDGAQLLDTRDAADYEGAHLKGSVNIGLGGQYASWAGTLLRRDRPIVLVTESGAEEESALRLGRIGFDHIAGYLEGGMHALDARPDLLEPDRPHHRGGAPGPAGHGTSAPGAGHPIRPGTRRQVHPGQPPRSLEPPGGTTGRDPHRHYGGRPVRRRLSFRHGGQHPEAERHRGRDGPGRGPGGLGGRPA